MDDRWGARSVPSDGRRMLRAMPAMRIILVKRGTWRGAAEEWSNGYCVQGTMPADKAAAETMALGLHKAEDPFYVGSQLVQWYFYEDTGEKTTVKYGKDLRGAPIASDSNSGKAMDTTLSALQLEQVSHIRGQAGYTEKGRPRYVHKFFHGAIAKSGSNNDKIAWATTGLEAKLAKFTDGTLPGGIKVCRPDGMVCETFTADPFVGTRTLKRRGKRPSPISQG